MEGTLLIPALYEVFSLAYRLQPKQQGPADPCPQRTHSVNLSCGSRHDHYAAKFAATNLLQAISAHIAGCLRHSLNFLLFMGLLASSALGKSW